MTVQPFELVHVEGRRIAAHTLESESLDQLVDREDVRPIVVSPPEQRQVVDIASGRNPWSRYALTDTSPQRFESGLPSIVDEQREMSERRELGDAHRLA